MHYETRQSALGAATLLLAFDPDWTGDLKKYMVDELIPAHRHGKLAFFVGEDEQPIGFIVWANLSEETEHRIIETDDPWLHSSEWNEGSSLWIRYIHLRPHYWMAAIEQWEKFLGNSNDSIRTLFMRKGQFQILEIGMKTARRIARLKSRNY